ncbi:hypothetical protein [uncultured Paludibaculum sp.]|uniref:hypothetical protein n=1 Tax=uncultured Paludibaculum sp. TaxID=1765020 RepID=UPI002AAB42BF|nr:hypothetical protein [uncultured Paludibaculum sp.]
MQGQYPLDTDALRKGTVLSETQLGQITGCKPGTDAYRFQLMEIQKFIHTKTQCTARIAGDTIAILTDAEASVYNHTRLRAHVVGIARRHSLMLKVDAGQLTESNKVDHDKRLLGQSRIVSAIAAVNRSMLAGGGYTRSTPGLLRKVS